MKYNPLSQTNTTFKSDWFEYTKKLEKAVQDFKDVNKIKDLADVIYESFDGNSEIHVLGNGGSSANAHHIVGDFTKTFCLYKQELKISSLSDNGCYMTATSNDIDYSEVFSFLIPNRIRPADKIIFLSGSGNSSNLVKCALKAKLHGIKTASITGYDGGKLFNTCDININFKINDMEIAEDLQLICFHFLKQYLCQRLSEEKHINPIDSPKYFKRVQSGEVV